MTYFASPTLNLALSPVLASSSALQTQAGNILAGIEVSVPAPQSILCLRTVLTPIVEDEPSLARLALSETAQADAKAFTASSDQDPTASLLTELEERTDILKGLVEQQDHGFSSPEAAIASVEQLERVAANLREDVEATILAGTDDQAILAAFKAAGLQDCGDIETLRRALQTILHDDVLADMPTPLAGALRALRGDTPLTSKQQALLEMDLSEFTELRTRYRSEGEAPSPQAFTPHQGELLAKFAPTLLEARQLRARANNAVDNIGRTASDDLRVMVGMAARDFSSEALTLSKIKANPGDYQVEPVEVVLFDFDGTLRRRRGLIARYGQLWWEWLVLDVIPHPRHSVGVSLIKTLALVIPGAIQGAIEKVKGEGDGEATQRIIARALELGDANKFERSFERFIKYYGDMCFSPFAMAELKKQMNAGRLVIISSASPTELVQGVLAKYGVPKENVQGTSFGVETDAKGKKFLTGEFHWNHDVRKLDKLEKELWGPLRKLGVDWRISAVYTDSPSDTPLVELAVKGKEPGIVYTTNCSKRPFEDEVLDRHKGVNVKEQSGPLGFLIGGTSGTLRIIRERQDTREVVETNVYREPFAPYVFDSGRNIARQAVPQGLAYYGGSVAADAMVHVAQNEAVDFISLMTNTGSIAMGTTAAMAAMVLSYGLVRGEDSPFMRRVWIQRVFPLLIGASAAGIEAPNIASYPEFGLYAGLGLFLYQGIRWGFDAASLVQSGAPNSDDSSGSETSGEEPAVNSPFAAAAKKIAVTASVTAAMGGIYYLTGSPEFGSLLATSLTIGMVTEGVATLAREGTRSSGLAETDQKKSWFGDLLGRGTSTSLQMIAFRLAEVLSRVL